jgi:MFS family permease
MFPEEINKLEMYFAQSPKREIYSNPKTTPLPVINKKYILPVIVLSQFAGTSLWFVGNALLPELKQSLQLDQYAVSLVTSAVLLGFVAGTLVFAFLSLADRFSPVHLFFFSSLLGAATTLAIPIATNTTGLFMLRFFAGFFMAGIYPVGMKIAADWYEKGLGKALGYLIGALVLGTAFPHLLRNRDFALPWKHIIYYTSAFAIAGGFLMLLIGNGPYRKKAGRFAWNALPAIFKSLRWRQAAFGYFGHMWELYALWGFAPVILELYAAGTNRSINIPLFSFLVIAIGSIGSVVGGYAAQRFGSARIAFISLLISGCCCLLSPLFFLLPVSVFIGLLMLWGFAAVPDSPQLSTLVAQYAPEQLRGTALTIYNSIGFFITIISLQVLDRIVHSNGWLSGKNSFILLGIGPLLGLISIYRLQRSGR